jgi:hypothetical protein
MFLKEYFELRLCDVDPVRPSFMAQFEAFRRSPSLSRARALQKLSLDQLSATEMLYADLASLVVNDRVHFVNEMMAKQSKSREAFVMVHLAARLMRTENTEQKIGKSYDLRYGFGFKAPDELDANAICRASTWAQVYFLVVADGDPRAMRAASKVSKVLSERFPRNVKIQLVCARELGQNGSERIGNAPSTGMVFSPAEAKERTEMEKKIYQRILAVDANCDIAIWAVGVSKYISGSQKEGREMIVRAYEMFKKRPTAKVYATMAAEFLSKHP